MSLQLILGSSGAGKSHTLYSEVIKKSIEHPDEKYFIIVPEQFTMQTQKDLVSMHPRKGIMNIDILSFMRLAYRIFEETQTTQKLVLEDTGKSMVVRKVVERKKEELKLFQNNVQKQGFMSEIKSLLSELFQYSVDREQLEKMIRISQKKPLLQRKLEDMLVVYDGFRELLCEKYITAEEILEVLEDVIGQSEIIKNSIICLDGFTGFTPSQYKLLRRLMKMCKKVIISVTIDPREEDKQSNEEFNLFYLSKKTMIKLSRIAQEEKVQIEQAVILKDNVPYRFKNSRALAALEHNLFRYPWKPFVEVQKDIRLYKAKDMEGEVLFTIKEITRLVREEGLRYRDIAVITGDIENYARVIEKEYEKAQIPCFIDYKKDILANPLVEFIRATLEVLQRDFDYESIFRYLRCGLVGIESEKVDILENYVLALGIRGFSKWNQKWSRVYRKDIEIDLEQINEIRAEIITTFLELRQAVEGKGHTVLALTTALHSFLCSMQVYKRLQEYQERFEQEHLPLLVKEYAQIYEIVLELLDKLVELLGDERVSLKEYKELLETGFVEAKVGLIPPGIDQVMIGDMERTRLKDIKVLFFLGVNDGIIPRGGKKGGILSDMERELLLKEDIELAPSQRQSAYTEQFYLYLSLTKPQNKLYVTFRTTGSDGKKQAPSYLIAKLEQLFPKLRVEEERLQKYSEEIKEEDFDGIWGADQGKRYLLEGLRQYSYDKMSSQWKELFSFYFQTEDFKEELYKLVEAACYTNEENGITRAVAKVLYGKELHNSVTRVEKYAACAFAHFLAYGMRLNERQEYRLGVPDLGNIFHGVLELFSNRLKEMQQPWRTLTEELRDTLVAECMDKVTQDYGNTILKSSKRNEYMIKRMERITKRTIWALCEHIKRGAFEPIGYEIQFSYLDGLDCVKVALSEEESMRLKGRIDRVDIYEEEEEIYVKIIDYKSGGTTFQLEDFYYGLQMQLVVYLNAALELEQRKHPQKQVIPAGIFYYNIADPMVDRNVEEEIEGDILKELKMNGLINQDNRVLQSLDASFGTDKNVLNASVKSKIIPVETGKDGEIGKRSSVARAEEFDKLTHYVREKIKEYGSEILDGTTKIAPYKLGDKTACDYCAYGGICGFDRKLPGNQYRKLKRMGKEEIWQAIEAENTGGENG